MQQVQESDEDIVGSMDHLLYENGVLRQPIAFGDPFHVANLCVTWASVFAFGDTEKADHSQVHHRQLLQSIHSLHSTNTVYSQKVMDLVMSQTGKTVRMTSKRERVQH